MLRSVHGADASIGLTETRPTECRVTYMIAMHRLIIVMHDAANKQPVTDKLSQQLCMAHNAQDSTSAIKTSCATNPQQITQIIVNSASHPFSGPSPCNPKS